jgi:hypothetical protein
MKNAGRTSPVSRRNDLLKLLTSEFRDAARAYDLFVEFLRRETYDADFCLKLIAVARGGGGTPWEVRRLAVLMLEHQILKLPPEDLGEFDLLLTRLNLKRAPGRGERLAGSLLKEGYTTTDLRGFVPELRRRLERLRRVHERVRGRRTPRAALRDFIELSRRDCKLSLARYLLTPAEVVAEILRRVRATAGVRDLDTSAPPLVEAEAERAVNLLPDFEAEILRRLRETADVYWVSDAVGSEINSLVEYPLTTVVLVVKPPGSDVEFELKRAGRRGRNPLGVVYARGGYTVPPSHRLDGGNMQWLLRYEANAAARFGLIYRLAHGTEAPMPAYVSRTTIASVPAGGGEVRTLLYFTEPRLFGEGFREMRAAMAESLEAFRAEGDELLPELPGDLGLTARFIGHVAPAQAILCGTSSFRLDKLAAYLSGGGPEKYFGEGLGVAHDAEDARRLADELLDEVLGVYTPPRVAYHSHEQYVRSAFRVAENRARADRVYLSLMRQIATFWGTLLAARGYSRGESFVARNVGLKSFWDGGRWKVRIIFMDHDALSGADPHDRNFYAHGAVPNMALDETYIWGRSRPEQFASSEAGCLQKIYRVGDALAAKGRDAARASLKRAYQKTLRALTTDPRLRRLFHEQFLDRLLDWDVIVGGHLRANGDRSAAAAWRRKMKMMLAAKGYGPRALDGYIETVEKNRAFLERNYFLFEDVGEERVSPNQDRTGR